MEVLDLNRAEATEIVLESDAVASALRAYMDGRPEMCATSTDLLVALTAIAPDHASRSKDWPPNPRALAGRLRRLAPALRGIGLLMTFEQRGHDRRRLIFMKRSTDAF